MTAVAAAAAQAAPLVVRNLVHWLETGEVPDGLFTDDVFCDLTVPTWRLQARGADAVPAMRARATRRRDGCRALDTTRRPLVSCWSGRRSGTSTATTGTAARCCAPTSPTTRSRPYPSYCTGDWSTAHRARHAAEVTLLRP